LDDVTWSDHTDIRPTILALAGFRDDYETDGRLLAESLYIPALPPAIANAPGAFIELSTAYKQLTAPFGAASRASVVFATAGIKAGGGGYAEYQGAIAQYLQLRDPVVARIRTLLNQAVFDGIPLPEPEAAELTASANGLITYIQTLAKTQY
jgi:hypothetical protein